MVFDNSEESIGGADKLFLSSLIGMITPHHLSVLGNRRSCPIPGDSLIFMLQNIEHGGLTPSIQGAEFLNHLKLAI